MIKILISDPLAQEGIEVLKKEKGFTVDVKIGIKPEELPPAEDIKKLERNVASDEKKIEKATKKLPKQKK